jgi:hypothetical protein
MIKVKKVLIHVQIIIKEYKKSSVDKFINITFYCFTKTFWWALSYIPVLSIISREIL